MKTKYHIYQEVKNEKWSEEKVEKNKWVKNTNDRLIRYKWRRRLDFGQGGHMSHVKSCPKLEASLPISFRHSWTVRLVRPTLVSIL